ncbi:MAG: hypothetical protein ACKOPS_18715, partial [Cyanobium sp.]
MSTQRTWAPRWARALTTSGSFTAAMLPLMPTRIRRPATASAGPGGTLFINRFLLHQTEIGPGQYGAVDRQGPH